MKSVVYKKYGSPDHLKIVEKEKPTPKAKEVLIKVKAVAINSADHRFLMSDPFFLRFSSGLFHPKIETLGSDISGQVVEVGPGVEKIKVGDRVIGALADAGFGGLSEYINLSEDLVTTFEGNISYESAAATPMPAIVALQAIRDKAMLKPGQKIAINGASGGVGGFAIQIAKHYGAHVTAICSGRNADNAYSSGADEVIDYHKMDFTENESAYDVILGVNGYHPIKHYERALKEDGKYIMIGGQSKQLIEAGLKGKSLSRKTKKSFEMMLSVNKLSDLEEVSALLEKGVIEPIVDRVFPFAQTSEAFHYYGEGRAKGKVVIVF
ncbi:NAD(P)-dependent alcohol dehydrogenase [Fusibacter sp. JL216-2]|uniref:NAD(P)-dependent alcohol dehydrogenase n=1 Tax=Fusibacter sp. JL216-2 TaxID=3071453 RepID=UPI003D340128